MTRDLFEPSSIGTIEQRLTLAMYDLSAPHVVRRLGGQIRSIGGTLECIIDPSDTKNGKHGEMEETDALQRLDNMISRMDIVWASVKKTGSLFATSYHSKVAVADGRRFWLSSGNWQHSNQPDIDPIKKAEDVPQAKKRNREWHVIVDHPGLATMFEKFIRYDRDQSRPFDNKPKKLREVDLFVASDDIAESFLAAPRRFFEPLEISDRLRVQPLLTPDNFLDHIIPLIESADRAPLHPEPVFLDSGSRKWPGQIPQARRRHHRPPRSRCRCQDDLPDARLRRQGRQGAGHASDAPASRL